MPHPATPAVERPAVQPTTPLPTDPTIRTRHATRHEIHELVTRSVDDVERRLGLRPDVHLDWPTRSRVRSAVARAVADALTESLSRLAEHEGTTSAFLSVSWRDETVEVCVVDDGAAPVDDCGHGEQADGVEQDVDVYGPVGTCQWWSIPTDLR